ncbi:hypothetical protein QAD02_018917 [Eretmocerus hayati]|uniref:Uncharacterized protein n=1 Tax=Eretmocerus hayati TaxID=131215 RepID=A0ACC2PHQ9_9HYME|nr:hypothetical protein QAD02_018917 [Eretmocerus hayati]
MHEVNFKKTPGMSSVITQTTIALIVLRHSQRKKSNRFKVFVHSYNQFSDEYSRKVLDTQVEVFPVKDKDFYGIKLAAVKNHESENYISGRNKSMKKLFYETDFALTKSLLESLNCKLLSDQELKAHGQHVDPKSIHRIRTGLFLPFTGDIVLSSRFDPHNSWEIMFHQQFYQIHIPEQAEYHFYLMRPKLYEKKISMKAIIAFGGLIFTAWIFAIWAYLLGFKERNWSFLNILTAQMGGSIEHQGQMKLSEMIFQMSIYTATFIIVTLGSDYMFEIFILQPTLTEVKTIQNLLDSNLNLTMDYEDFTFFGDRVMRDSILQEVFIRTQPQNLTPETHSFCTQPSSSTSILDESINFCISYSRYKRQILEQHDEYQIDRIENPFLVTWISMFLLSPQPFFKYRLEEMIQKFLERGLLEHWKQETKKLSPKSNTVTIEGPKDAKVPPQHQSLPLFTVGCILSVIALICELIWKYAIEDTNLGRLARAFYNYSRQNSSSPTMNSFLPTMTVSQTIKWKQIIRSTEVRPSTDPTLGSRKFFSMQRNLSFDQIKFSSSFANHSNRH